MSCWFRSVDLKLSRFITRRNLLHLSSLTGPQKYSLIMTVLQKAITAIVTQPRPKERETTGAVEERTGAAETTQTETEEILDEE